MGLEFTTIKDRHGVSIFIISDEMSRNVTKMRRLAEDVSRHTAKQVIMLTTGQEDARKIADFYDLQAGTMVLLVRDDDQLHHIWYEQQIPRAEQIAHMANQIG